MPKADRSESEELGDDEVGGFMDLCRAKTVPVGLPVNGVVGL